MRDEMVITVDKAALVATVSKNRDEHRDIFLKAQERFKARVMEELEKRLARARDGRQVDLAIRLPEPVDYTDSYDTVLDMLAWEQGDTVELTREDFERYVRNNWEWAKLWHSNTTSYVG